MSNPSEQPRQKRKYTKKSKMLLRSNYDYIDHDYWPRVYKEAKEIAERMKIEHPERYAKKIPDNTYVEVTPMVTRKITPEELAQQDIDNCAVYGIVCSKHNIRHVPK